MKRMVVIATLLVAAAALVLTGCASLGKARRPVDPALLYYVDAGDGLPETLEEGELFGTMNGVKDQPYGKDPVTGRTWGFDTPTGPGNSYAEDNGPSPMESVRTDESGLEGEGLIYRFAVPNGNYLVELGFLDFWTNANRFMDIIIEGAVVEEGFLVEAEEISNSYEATVADGELTVSFVRSAGVTGEYEDPLVNLIKVRLP